MESFFAEKNAKRALDDEKRKYKINGNADRWDEYYQPDPHADEDVQLSSDRQSLDEKNDESQMITKDTRFIWDFENKEKYTRKKCEMSKLTAEVEKKQISHKQYPRVCNIITHHLKDFVIFIATWCITACDFTDKQLCCKQIDWGRYQSPKRETTENI